MYRFREHYDLPKDGYNKLPQLRVEYQLRRKALRSPPKFVHGFTKEEQLVLTVVRDLLLRECLSLVSDLGRIANILQRPEPLQAAVTADHIRRIF